MSAAAIAQIVKTIKREKKFVILSHESPDGDAIGSQLALCAALKRIGKDVVLVSDRVPRKYQFLPGSGDTTHGLDVSMEGRVAVFVDTPTLERLGDGGGMDPIFKSIINIDHHVSNVRFGTYNWVDVSASSVG
ncbi:MAG TPA: DHH family phosphoesterase, partial [bacterium]|nr:DHH family phosphoesterase [bacterium]